MGKISKVDKLNESQREICEYDKSDILIIAGPGSGKTRVLTHKISNIIESNKADLSEIMAVTFTNKAAEEMKSRVETLLERDVRGCWISTFHSMCLRLLRIYSNEANLPKNFSILDVDGSRQVIVSVLREYDIPAESEIINRIRKDISRVKNNLENSLLNVVVENGVKLKEIHKKYQNRMEEMYALDFDDILLRLKGLLEENEDCRRRVQKLFKYILIDEFQDTNKIQYEIIKLIYSSKSKLIVVGDVDQSIYAFRGSSPELMLKLKNDFSKIKTFYLMENYRSTPEIVQFADDIIRKNPSEHRKPLVAKNKKGNNVKVVECYDDIQEAKYIADEIKNSEEETAILIRVNSQSRVLESELINRKIPYSLIGGVKFYDRKEVKDLLSYIKFTLNPNDEISFTRSLNLPKRGLGDVAINKIKERTKQIKGNLKDGTEDLLRDGFSKGKQRDGLEKFSLILSEVEGMLTAGPEKIVKYLINETGIKEYYLQSGSDGVERVENLNQLLIDASEFEKLYKDIYKNEDLTVEWVNHISLNTTNEGDEKSKIKTFIMTAHASKGREFERVFVAGVEDGLFPLKRYGDEIDNEEERRLLYVACTRAKKYLTVSYSTNRFLYGNRSVQNISPFLDEVEVNYDKVVKKANIQEQYKRSRNISKMGVDNPELNEKKTRRLAKEDCIVGRKIEHIVHGSGVIRNVNGDYIIISFNGEEKTFRVDIAPLWVK